MLTIQVTLPRDRTRLGTLICGDFTCACLGKSDSLTAHKNGNHSRDPLKQFGDTPLGTYTVSIGPVGWPMSSYGTHPVLTMDPTGGDALVAESVGKRSGLLIHGGALNREGKLRPTFGCIRVRNEHQKELVDRVKRAGGTALLIVSEG